MGESLFSNRNIKEFVAAHPDEEGWKVYELPGDVVSRKALCYLIDCLQERYPECVKRRMAIKCVEEEGLNVLPHAEDIEVPHKEVEAGRDLRSDSWYGEIDLEWVGYAVHFKCFLLKTGHGYTTVYHVATRSSIALSLCLDALERYGRTRVKTADTRKITVINGRDIPITPIEWADIALPAGLLDGIRRSVVGFFESRERYRALGIPYRRGLLFSGPPGCGKTLTIKALAYHASAKFITTLGKANVDDSDIQSALELAGTCAPAVVIFEDIEKLLEARDVSLSYFLNLLDGLKVLDGILVIATCNEPEKLDPALLHRPSRFDRVWTFPLPGYEQRLALLRRRGEPYFSGVTLKEVAEKSHGFSMAYVQEIIVNALLESAHNGAVPCDADLLRSLSVLQSQRKTVARKLDSLVEHESVGFALPNGD